MLVWIQVISSGIWCHQKISYFSERAI